MSGHGRRTWWCSFSPFPHLLTMYTGVRAHPYYPSPCCVSAPSIAKYTPTHPPGPWPADQLEIVAVFGAAKTRFVFLMPQQQTNKERGAFIILPSIYPFSLSWEGLFVLGVVSVSTNRMLSRAASRFKEYYCTAVGENSQGFTENSVCAPPPRTCSKKKSASIQAGRPPQRSAAEAEGRGGDRHGSPAVEKGEGEVFF